MGDRAFGLNGILEPEKPQPAAPQILNPLEWDKSQSRRILSPLEWDNAISAVGMGTQRMLESQMPMPYVPPPLSEREPGAGPQGLAVDSQARATGPEQVQHFHNAYEKYAGGVIQALAELNRANAAAQSEPIENQPVASENKTKMLIDWQKNAMRNAYSDVIAGPAGNIAITPGVPLPVRILAGALYAPKLAGDIEHAILQKPEITPEVAAELKQNPRAGPQGLAIDSGKTVERGRAGNVFQKLVNEPIEEPARRFINDPGQFLSDIYHNPTKLWPDILLPGTMAHGVTKPGINAVKDVVKDTVNKKIDAADKVDIPITANKKSATEKSGALSLEQKLDNAVKSQDLDAMSNVADAYEVQGNKGTAQGIRNYVDKQRSDEKAMAAPDKQLNINDKPIKVIDLVDDPQMPTDNAAALRKYLLEKYRDLKVGNENTGNIIAFYRDGIEASLKNRDELSRRAYAVLPELLEKAVFDSTAENTKVAKRPHISHYDTYWAALKIDGEVHPVKITVDVANNKFRDRGYYYHTVKQIEVADAVGINPGVNEAPAASSTSSTNISPGNSLVNNHILDCAIGPFAGQVRHKTNELAKSEEIIDAGEQAKTVVQRIRDSIKDERGSISPEKMGEALPHIYDLGKRVLAEGFTTAHHWYNRMKEYLGDMWGHFKDHMSKVWRFINNERGGSRDNLTLQDKVNSFVEEALAKHGSKRRLILDTVSADEVYRIKKLTGIDTTGFRHELNNHDLRHAIKHRDAIKEAESGQLPITEKDLKLIPQVLRNYDSIEPGSISKGRKSVRYIKKVNGHIVIAEVIIPEKGILNVKTMWKKPAVVNRDKL